MSDQPNNSGVPELPDFDPSKPMSVLSLLAGHVQELERVNIQLQNACGNLIMVLAAHQLTRGSLSFAIPPPEVAAMLTEGIGLGLVQADMSAVGKVVVRITPDARELTMATLQALRVEIAAAREAATMQDDDEDEDEDEGKVT